MDADHLGQLAPAVFTATARAACALALAQQGDELAAQLTTGIGIDRVVERLMAHTLGGIIRMHAPQCAGNLLRRPAAQQQIGDHMPQRPVGMQLGQGTRGDATLLAQALSGGRPVGIATAVAGHLAAQGAGAAPQLLSNAPQAPALLEQGSEGQALFRLQVAVSGAHRDNLPQDGGVALRFGDRPCILQTIACILFCNVKRVLSGAI